MLQKPRFKPHYVVRVVEGEGVLFLTENQYFSLQGKVYEQVANVINGQRTRSEIINHLNGSGHSKEIEDAIADLEKRGLLCEATDSLSENEAAFWWTQDIDPDVSLQRFQTQSVSVHTFGNISSDTFVDALRSLRVKVENDAKIGIVLTDDYLAPGLAEYNNESLNLDRQWMLIKPVGTEIWIGPIFIPGKTGCWQCLAYRLRSNRNAESFLLYRTKEQKQAIAASRAFTPATLNIALSLAATKVAKWIAQEDLPELEGQIYTQQILADDSEVHRLVWRPQCPACGDFDEAVSETTPPIVLQSSQKLFTVDGGHRVTMPEATFEKYRHHISPISGVVKKLDRHPISTSSIHVYGGSMNCTIAYENIKSLNDVMNSSGKGASDAQARASALCESLERYCGIYRGDEPRRKAKLKELGDAGIHPNEYLHYSQNQYKNRDAWNALKNSKLFVPQPFGEEAEIEWSPAWSLTRNQVRYFPTAYCYYLYPFSADRSFCNAHSNGNSAGNTIEEAILQGFFELVERDAIGIWWYNRIQRPLVDWKSFHLPYLDEVEQYHHKQHREIWVLDITADLGIPAFTAVSRRTDDPCERIILGFGSHMDAKIALLRAMTELNQGMVWTMDSSHHSQHDAPKYYESLKGDVNLDTVTLKDLPHVVPDTRTTPRTEQDYPHHWTDDIKHDVLACKEIVERNGMEFIVLDQTRADVGIPVVKVIVPGMRHFWPRFAPGRLYDVPVKLGWLPRQLTEDELNPIMVFS